MQMGASTINPINGEVNTFSAGGGNNLYNSDSLTSANSLVGNNSPIPGGGINPFAGDAGNKLQQLIFDRLKLILGENFFKDTDNALAGGSNLFTGSSSPIVSGGSLLQQSPFDPLKEVLGNNIPFNNSGNTSNTTSPPFNKDNAPVGNGNRNFGNDNATIGNFNSDYGNSSATIGNGNWNFNNNNATIGNGNWQFGGDNTTLGNGNWYWDYGSKNATLGNGNWYFGSDNATVGNGNWDFGNNNLIIGNGNWIFSDGNTIIGNGNWLIDSDNANNLDLLLQENKTDINNLIDSLIGKIGQNFTELTGDLSVSSTQTLNRLILSKSLGINDNNISKDIEQLLISVNRIQEQAIAGQHVENSQSVPEPSSVSLVGIGFLCLLLSIFKKRQHKY